MQSGNSVFFSLPNAFSFSFFLSRELTDGRDKFRNGLNKILETNDLIAKMETELTALRPTLEAKQRDTEKLMIKLSEDQEQVIYYIQYLNR